MAKQDERCGVGSCCCLRWALSHWHIIVWLCYSTKCYRLHLKHLSEGFQTICSWRKTIETEGKGRQREQRSVKSVLLLNALILLKWWTRRVPAVVSSLFSWPSRRPPWAEAHRGEDASGVSPALPTLISLRRLTGAIASRPDQHPDWVWTSNETGIGPATRLVSDQYSICHSMVLHIQMVKGFLCFCDHVFVWVIVKGGFRSDVFSLLRVVWFQTFSGRYAPHCPAPEALQLPTPKPCRVIQSVWDHVPFVWWAESTGAGPVLMEVFYNVTLWPLVCCCW